MALKKKDGTPANELAELDVDRIDGVDKPATGRAFALFKSETPPLSDDMQQIIRSVLRLKSASDPYAAIISAACDNHIVKMLDSRDALVGYVVKGDDVSSPLFKTLDDAVAFVTRVVMGEVAKGRRAAEEPDQMLTHTSPGGMAALDDPNNNASGQSLLEEKKNRISLWDRHKAKGAMIDGQRMPDTKRKGVGRLDGRAI